MKKQSAKNYRWKNRQGKPANFVLWCDGLDFYVSERVGPKGDSSSREHFVAFFTRESDAWLQAEARTWELVSTLEKYIDRFRKERRKAYKNESAD